jgi:hypothetical protein
MVVLCAERNESVSWFDVEASVATRHTLAASGDGAQMVLAGGLSVTRT